MQFYGPKHQAYFLAYIDRCLHDGSDWRNTIAKDVKKDFNKKKFKGIRSVQAALNKLLESFDVPPDLAQLAKEGTAYIAANGGQIPREITDEMNKWKLTWDLGNFSDSTEETEIEAVRSASLSSHASVSARQY